jgi:DNA-binding LytR/AlgR family response regulator
VKCEVIICSDLEEKVGIYAKEKNAIVEEIRLFAEQTSNELLGYEGSEIVKLNSSEIHYITIIDNRVYACLDKERYLLKERLYSLEAKLNKNFVKINQSTIANIKKMERFDTSISGTLKIRFKNGDVDYVSRRQLKTIKERLGI